jgi:hypothetical protein
MKLVIATAVAEYEKELKNILQKAEVLSYSYQTVKGFSNKQGKKLEGNWFASDGTETNSVAFFAFVKKEKVKSLFEYVETFNNTLNSVSHIHLAEMSVDKSN